jgi:hypothetical protein
MRQNRDLIPVTVYLDPALVARYDEQARREERSLSAELRRILVASDPRPDSPDSELRPGAG